MAPRRLEYGSALHQFIGIDYGKHRNTGRPLFLLAAKKARQAKEDGLVDSYVQNRRLETDQSWKYLEHI